MRTLEHTWTIKDPFVQAENTHISVQINPVGTTQTITSHGLPATIGSEKKQQRSAVFPQIYKVVFCKINVNNNIFVLCFLLDLFIDLFKCDVTMEVFMFLLISQIIGDD